MTVAAAEPTAASELDALRPPHVVLHGCALPRQPAPIANVVLGPGGVFVVEAKRYASTVVVKGGVALCGDRLLTPVLETLARRAAAVRAAMNGTGVDVRGVLCVLSPVEPDGKRNRLLVGGVEITSLRWLTRVVTREHKVLSEADLLRVAAIAALRLHPTGRAPCACGGDLGVRRRKADGAAVLACSNHPRCRVVLPLRGA